GPLLDQHVLEEADAGVKERPERDDAAVSEPRLHGERLPAKTQHLDRVVAPRDHAVAAPERIGPGRSARADEEHSRAKREDCPPLASLHVGLRRTVDPALHWLSR